MSPSTASFVDGQQIERIRFGYKGAIEIIHGMTQVETDAFMRNYQEIRTRYVEHEAKPGAQDKDGYVVLDVRPQMGMAFETKQRRDANIKLKNSVLHWTGYIGLAEVERESDFKHVMENLVSRDLFSIPREPGICLPYAFIRDDKQSPRFISMGFRLKEHPDVTIVLSESDAEVYDEAIRERNAQPDREIDDFWNYFPRRLSQERVGSIWEFPIKRPVQLAGQKGLAAFVKILREDTTADFGYTAVVRGDPKSKLDRPDLGLYIIQSNANARSRGIIPLNQQEFLSIAEGIADSIKPHYTKTR